jgi:hypothetical protein
MKCKKDLPARRSALLPAMKSLRGLGLGVGTTHRQGVHDEAFVLRARHPTHNEGEPVGRPPGLSPLPLTCIQVLLPGGVHGEDLLGGCERLYGPALARVGLQHRLDSASVAVRGPDLRQESLEVVAPGEPRGQVGRVHPGPVQTAYDKTAGYLSLG